AVSASFVDRLPVPPQGTEGKLRIADSRLSAISLVLKLAFCTDDSGWQRVYAVPMADSSQNGARRRYVRPWEFEVLKELESRTSILESSSFNRRLVGQLNRTAESHNAA